MYFLIDLSLFEESAPNKAETVRNNPLSSHDTPLSTSPVHSGSDIEPAVLAHITRVMKLLSSDYYYSSCNIPAIEVSSVTISYLCGSYVLPAVEGENCT